MQRFILAACLLLALPFAAFSQESVVGGGVYGGGSIIGKASPSIWLTADSFAYQDAAVQFNDADNSWLQILDADQTGLDFGTGDFAFSGWVYVDSASGNHTVVTKGNWYIYINSARKFYLEFRQNAGGSWQAVTCDTALDLSTWYHFVANYDRSGNMELFLNTASDGVKAISSQSGTVDNTQAFYVGNAATSVAHQQFDGRLDSLGCWNRTLTTAEITSLYNSGVGLVYSDVEDHATLPTNIVSWWDFSEATGTRYDSVGVNHLSQSFSEIIAPAVYGSEELTNGGFETAGAGGADIWGTWIETAGSGALANETTIIHGGSDAAKLTGSVSNDTFITQNVSGITASADYRLTYWTRGTGVVGNSASHHVRQTNGTPADLVAVTASGVNGTEWTKVAVDFTAAASTTDLKVQFYPDNTANDVYVDDVSLVKITTAALNNGDFEDWTVPSAAQLVTDSSLEDTQTNPVTASAIIDAHGVESSGSYTDTATDDGTYWVIDEEAGETPGYHVEMTIGSITGTAKTLLITGFYEGNAGHNVDVNVWDEGDTAWDTLGQMAHNTTDQVYEFALNAEHTDSSQVVVRIEHTTAGSAGHDLNLDFVGVVDEDQWVSWAETVGSGSIVETATVHSGSAAVKLTEGASDDTWFTQDTLAATTGEVWRLTFWTRVDASDNAGRFGIWGNGGAGWITDSIESTGVTATSYTKVTRDFICPASTTSIFVRVYPSATNTDVAYFDDVELVQLPSNSDSWTETLGGSAFIRREDTETDNGAHAACMDVVGGGLTDVTQAILTANKLYTYATRIDADSGTPTITIGDNGSGGSTNPHTLSASYDDYAGSFRARSSGTGEFSIRRSSASGKKLYIDSVTLTAAEILAAAGIARGVSQDANFATQLDTTGNQYYDYSGTAFDTDTDDWTFGIWFYMDTSTGATKTLASAGAQHVDNEYWWLYVSSVGNLRCQFNDGDGGAIIDNAHVTQPQPGEWNFVLVKVDRTNDLLTLVLNDGAEDDESTAGKDDPVDPGELYLGAYSTGGLGFPGRLDNAFFLPRLTTSAEQTWLFNSGAGRQYSECGVASPANDGSTLTDFTAFWEFDDADDLGADSVPSLVELVTNGGFDSDTTGWTPLGSAVLESVGSGYSGNCLSVTNGAAFDDASQVITTVAGASYSLTLWHKKGTAGTGAVLIGTSAGGVQIWNSGGLNYADWTQVTHEFVASTATTYLTLATNSATVGHDTFFDSVSISPINDLTPQGTPTQDEGINYTPGLVSWWGDRRGNGLAAVQANMAKYPAYISPAINGKAALRFDGVDDYLQDAFTLNQPHTVFVIGKFGGTLQMMVDGATADAYIYREGAGDIYINAGTGLTGAAIDTSYHLVTAEFNGASSAVAIDGGADTEGAAGANGTGGVTLGSYRSGAAFFLDGEIAEVILVPSVLGASHRAAIESSLMNQYGISP